ncbi:hypothetical protein ACOMHN_031877 [Nucella lapillus]
MGPVQHSGTHQPDLRHGGGGRRHPPRSKPSAVALRIPAPADTTPIPTTILPHPHSAPGDRAADHDAPDADGVYSFLDEDDAPSHAAPPPEVAEDFGGYAAVGDLDLRAEGTVGPGPADGAPQGGEYAVVDKSRTRARAGPHNASRPAHDVGQEDENAYSVADLRPTLNSGGPPPSPPPAPARAEALPAQLEGNVYAQVRKPKASANSQPNPKPQPKPKPATPAKRPAEGEVPAGLFHPQEVTHSAPNDDDYNTLNLFQPPQQPRDDNPEDPVYSHLTHL